MVLSNLNAIGHLAVGEDALMDEVEKEFGDLMTDLLENGRVDLFALELLEYRGDSVGQPLGEESGRDR